MKAKELPPLEVLKELLYVKDGKLYWKVDRGTLKTKDKEAGYCHRDGYRRVKINSHSYLSHRIIYSLTHNVTLAPVLQVDHINRDKKDNSLENLRVVNHRENCYNRVRKNKVAGVYYDKRRPNRPWGAVIILENKKLHIGTYSTKEEAIEARLQAEKEHGIYIYRE